MIRLPSGPAQSGGAGGTGTTNSSTPTTNSALSPVTPSAAANQAQPGTSTNLNATSTAQVGVQPLGTPSVVSGLGPTISSSSTIASASASSHAPQQPGNLYFNHSRVLLRLYDYTENTMLIKCMDIYH